MTQAVDTRIPVTLLTGFLGSGKTTVLNQLVRQPAMSDALVIINEFGEIALDHMLVAHSTDNLIMEMGSGCLCCTVRQDLIKTLRDITWRFARGGQRQFRRVLIETTGLADPGPVIHTLATHPDLAQRYRLDGVITTLDLATGAESLAQHPEAVRQAAMADRILLTKGDLATPAQRSALLQQLDAINPAAPRQDIQLGQVQADTLLDLGLDPSRASPEDMARWLNAEAYPGGGAAQGHRHDHEHDHGHAHDHDHSHAHAHVTGHAHASHQEHAHHHGTTDAQDVNRHDTRIRAFCFTVDTPLAEEQVEAWLQILSGFVGSQILRIKGILNVQGRDTPLVIHGVRHLIHPPAALPAWPSEDHRSRMVFITQDVGPDVIATLFQALNQVPASP